MVNLILFSLGLSLTSFTITYPNALDNPVTSSFSIDSYTMQDGRVVYYSFDGSGFDQRLEYYNRYDIQFSGGQQFSFEIDMDTGELDNNDWYSLRFKVWKESYLSNIYLSNLHWEYYSAEQNGGQSAVYRQGYLKNVYFLGQSEYYEDDTSGDYTIQVPHDSSGNRSSLYLNFDICLMDSRLVDGSAYQNGYNEGWNAGNDNGFDDGYSSGYQSGYTDGVNDSQSSSSTALTIFTGIINVALVPVNVFLKILNFEVFGINIGGLVSAFLTIAIVIILWRIISGNKND